MKQQNKLTKAIAAALVLCGLFIMAGFTRQCEDISTRVVRLHVLANSDSEEDQALKLKVRDRILQEAQGLVGETADKAAALRQLSAAGGRRHRQRQGGSDGGSKAFLQDPGRDHRPCHRG